VGASNLDDLDASRQTVWEAASRRTTLPLSSYGVGGGPQKATFSPLPTLQQEGLGQVHPEVWLWNPLATRSKPWKIKFALMKLTDQASLYWINLENICAS